MTTETMVHVTQQSFDRFDCEIRNFVGSRPFTSLSITTWTRDPVTDAPTAHHINYYFRDVDRVFDLIRTLTDATNNIRRIEQEVF
jgi:hypothetical protein